MIVSEAPPSEVLDNRGHGVRDALLACVRRERIDWPVVVKWDAERIEAAIVRGELRISDDYWRMPPWWQVPRRDLVEDLARVLVRTHRRYAEADEDGYLVADTVIDGAPELVRLAPGVRQEVTVQGEREVYFRLGYHHGLGLTQALGAGWLRLL